MRYVLKLAYDGSKFLGFQRQPSGKTVQGQLERALKRPFVHNVEITGAGRTDTGVHATGQVVAFDSELHRPLQGMVKSVNRMLVPEAAILEAVKLPDGHDFHPRYSAKSRTYEYFVLANCEQCDTVLSASRHWVLPDQLDLKLMREACPIFEGVHDFETFTARSDMTNFRREVRELKVERLPPTHLNTGTAYKITITANGFLRRMVRLIVAAIVEAGMARQTPAELQSKLKARDSGAAPHPAPSQGLVFTKVHYDPDPFTLCREKVPFFRARPYRDHRFKS